MVDITQVLLITVVTILTIILSVIGIHIVFILQELKRSLEKLNKILEDAGVISGGVTKSFSGLSGLAAGLKTGMTMLNVFTKKEADSKDE